MKQFAFFFSVVLIAASGFFPTAQAGEPTWGSPKFQPTPEHPVGWRGDGEGRYPDATPPTKWSRTVSGGKAESSGILWMTPIPAGASSPIIVGDRIYVGFDPYGLLCISKTDGKILWWKTHHYYEVMPDEERKQIEDKAKPAFTKIKDALDAEIKRMSAAVSPAGVAATSEEKRFMGRDFNQKVDKAQKELDAAVLEAGKPKEAAATPDSEKPKDAPAAEGKPESNKNKYKASKNYWEWASATPTSDGKFVYMWFANRVGVCYDLDGNRQWATVGPGVDRTHGEHGRHSSPLLVADKFITQYANEVLAFERKTGKYVWTKSMKAPHWATPTYSSLAATTVAGVPYVVSCRGEAFRVSDGELGWGPYKDYAGENTTAIIDNDRIFLWDRAGMIQLQVPKTPGPGVQPKLGPSIVKKDKYYMVGSPLYLDGLVYFLSDKGLLRVFDSENANIVYEQQMPLKMYYEYVFFPGYSASPTLAGKYIYISDNQGGTVVIEPGRTYKEVAINKFETPERKNGARTVYEQTVSNPVFEGKLMLIRGQQYLYCIGSK